MKNLFLKIKPFIFVLSVILSAAFLFSCNSGDKTDETSAPTTNNNEESTLPPLEVIYGDELSYAISNDGTSYSVLGYFSELKSKSVFIPEEYDGLPVVAIESGAFSYDGVLEKIYIPDSVISIGEHAFDGCSNLKEIRMSSNIETVGAWAFDACDKLELTQYDNALYLGNESNPYLILLYVTDSEITSCRINDSTRIITDYAFADCTEVETVSIPDGIVNIGELVFENCYDLEFNKYDNAYYLGNENSPYLVLVDTVSRNIESCEIHPDTVAIGAYAFEGCASLEELVISDKIRFISQYSFDGCDALASVTVEGADFSVYPPGESLNAITVEINDPSNNAQRLSYIYYYCIFTRK